MNVLGTSVIAPPPSSATLLQIHLQLPDPFLDVIRSDQTSGPVTGQALSSVGKFLSYGSN